MPMPQPRRLRQGRLPWASLRHSSLALPLLASSSEELGGAQSEQQGLH